MLGMFVLDKYRVSEAREVYEALRNFVRDPTWSAAGVYSYWAPESHDILYLGLTSSIPRRFRDHNGLGSSGGSGNKLKDITEYFKSHDELGLTVGIQSSAAGEIGATLASDSEGQLLEDYRRRYGRFPPWNRIGGSKSGAALSKSDSSNIFEVITGSMDSLLVARRTLRYLVRDDQALTYEGILHIARMDAQLYAALGDQKISDADILRRLQSPPPMLSGEAPSFQRLLASGYLHERPFD